MAHPWYRRGMRLVASIGALGVLLVAATTLGRGKPAPLRVVDAALHVAAAPPVEPSPAAVRPALARPTRGVARSSAALSDGDAGIFESAEECQRLIALGHRAPRGKGQARVATWNVRYFPDGIPGDSPSPTLSTDVGWLACTIAWLNVEVIALAEVKSLPRSKPALTQLVTELERLTGDAHQFAIDSCPESSSQHLAYVWATSRVTARGAQLHAAVNPEGDACAGQLRPGFGMDFEFYGGLDLHAIAVHLKSGKTRRDWLLRRRSIEGLGRVVEEVVQSRKDADVLVLGDMNTMGGDGVQGLERGSAEIQRVDTALRAMRAPLRRLAPELMCSHYYGRSPALLDHFWVTTAMTEVVRDRTVEVHGYCRNRRCETATGETAEASLRLSDHCPLVLSLEDRDRDP